MSHSLRRPSPWLDGPASDGPTDFVVDWQLQTEPAAGVDLDLVRQHSIAVELCVTDPTVRL